MAGSILGSLLLEIVTKANTSGLSKTDSSIKKMGRTLQQTSKSASLLSKLSGALFGVSSFIGIKNAFTSYLQFEKNLGAINSRFYAIEGSVEGANKQFEFARKVANDTATSIQDVVDSYSIFYSSARKSPLGEAGAQEIYRSWTEVSRVLHLNGQQYERVMYALREMSSKGQLYAQDLLVQMGTHTPAIRDIAETAIKGLGIKGVTNIASFQTYSKKSGDKEAMAKFLLAFTRETKKRYASEDALKKALEQPDALEQQLHNLAWEFSYQFSKAGGSYMVVKILTNTLEWFKSIDFYGIASNLGKIAKFVGDIFNYLPTIMNILKDILFGVAIFSIGKFLMPLITGIGVFFRIFRSLGPAVPFLTKLHSGLVLAFPRLLKFLGFLFGGGLKTLLGTAVKALFLGGGPFGIIIGTLTMLPMLIDLVKFIANKLGRKEELSQRTLGDTGITLERAGKIAKEIEARGIHTPEQLKRELNRYGKEGANLQPFFNVDSQNNIKIYVEGIGEVSPSRIEEDKKTSVKQDKGGSWFNRPKKDNVKYNTW